MKFLIQQTVLTDFRPVFIVMVAILAIFFILSFIRQRDNGVSFAMVTTVSLIQLILAGVLFYTESNLVEGTNFAADDITLYLFVGIVVLAILNPIVHKLRNRQSQQRYRYKRY